MAFKSTTGLEVIPRRHGFERPLDTWQIMGWISIVILFVGYFTLHGPLLTPHTAAIAVSAILGVLAVVIVVIKITISLMPTEDPLIWGPQLDHYVLLGRGKPPHLFACQYCCRWVEKSSKHCATCDKCTIGFDHHCRWLNTCVGARNYKLFIAFVSSVLLAFLMVCTVSLVTIVRCSLDMEGYASRLREMYGGSATMPAYLTVVVLLFLYELAGAAVIGHLWCFHMWLIYSDLTTYDWLQKKAAAKRERDAARNEAAARGEDPPVEPGCCDVFKRRQFKSEKRLAAAPDNSPFGSNQPSPSKATPA